jgi:hypothetical protein
VERPRYSLTRRALCWAFGHRPAKPTPIGTRVAAELCPRCGVTLAVVDQVTGERYGDWERAAHAVGAPEVEALPEFTPWWVRRGP